VVAQSEEGPDRERLVEDRREERERREFVGVETSCLIDSVTHFGCKKLHGDQGNRKGLQAKGRPLIESSRAETLLLLESRDPRDK
jgi:hypothetical protein